MVPGQILKNLQSLQVVSGIKAVRPRAVFILSFTAGFSRCPGQQFILFIFCVAIAGAQYFRSIDSTRVLMQGIGYKIRCRQGFVQVIFVARNFVSLTQGGHGKRSGVHRRRIFREQGFMPDLPIKVIPPARPAMALAFKGKQQTGQVTDPFQAVILWYFRLHSPLNGTVKIAITAQEQGDACGVMFFRDLGDPPEIHRAAPEFPNNRRPAGSRAFKKR